MKKQATYTAASNIAAFLIGLVAGTAFGVFAMGEMRGRTR